MPRWLACHAVAKFLDHYIVRPRAATCSMTREGPFPTSKLTMDGDGPKTSYFRLVITRMVMEGRQHVKAISPLEADTAPQRSLDILGAITHHISPAARKLCTRRSCLSSHMIPDMVRSPTPARHKWDRGPDDVQRTVRQRSGCTAFARYMRDCSSKIVLRLVTGQKTRRLLYQKLETLATLPVKRCAG